MPMPVNWPTCDEDGCSGACTGDETKCLAHAGADEREAALKRYTQGGELDVRGVMISTALIVEIFNAAPHGAAGHGTFSAIRFDGATFEGDVVFSRATFTNKAMFGRATFKGAAVFYAATFEGGAVFTGATFKGDVNFIEAKFEGGAVFDRATFWDGVEFNRATFTADGLFGEAKFEGRARFYGAIFKGKARFGEVTFQDTAVFTGATFKGDAEFSGATFTNDGLFSGASFKGKAMFGKVTFHSTAGFDATLEADAMFVDATFEGDAVSAGPTFGGDAVFDGATFEGDAGFDATFKADAMFVEATFKGDVPVLGPIAVGGQLNLDRVQFASPVRIEADAGAITCRRGRFPYGVRFDVRHADVRLDDTDLSVPSLLTGPRSPAEIAGRPRLLSLQGANVAGLTLGNVNLAFCRFSGAHNLDKLRLEAGAVFGLSPVVAGWERRQVIAEEAVWRAARDRQGLFEASAVVGFRGGPARVLSPGDITGLYRVLRKGAYAVFGLSPAIAGSERRQVISEEAAWRVEARPGHWEAPWWPDSYDKPKVLSPGAVAVLYRALRKGREDAKDEPGAADFYYGEMEMRRHDRGEGHDGGGWSRGLVSRAVLTAYWLVSGYGLRAWRSLAALAAVMAVSAGVFRLWGFSHSTSYWKSLLFAFRSTLSLTDAQVNLTAWGGLFQALLRLTGPVLLALTLLALRGRVKR
jgi:uncharacterized protein YjbI with pentapeptide repeats